MTITNTICQTTTIAFQGNEGSATDNWGFTTSGASAAVLGYAALPGNKVSGSSSIAVGGNVSGTPGNCIAGTGSGNGTSVVHNITFNDLDVTSSNTLARTLTFSYGNYQPSCSGTGWDTGENLVFTPYHDLIAQSPTTLVSGLGNLSVNIATNSFTYSIPTGVNTFSFRLTISTNRNDEYLFVDDVRITIPVPLSSNLNYFYVSNTSTFAKIHWGVQKLNELAGIELQYSEEGERFNTMAEFDGSEKDQEFQFNADFLNKGFYRLKLVDTNGGFSYSKIVKVNEDGENDILLYPSPAKEQIIVESIIGILDFQSIKLYDITGNQYTPQWEGNKIDLKGMASGTYFLTTILNDEAKILRFVKE